MAKKKPSKNAADAPHIRDFISCAVEEFGGVKGFAKQYVEVFKASKKGSAAQGQLMANLSKLIFQHTARFGVTKELDEMSDQDLRNVIRRALAEDERLEAASDETEGDVLDELREEDEGGEYSVDTAD